MNDDADEPVSKRTRRSGVVASIGDPNLKDRSKVAPLFLTKKEKQDKLYKKEQDKLAQSTKTRLNDWKSVIGVEKDATKVCPVFQKAVNSQSTQHSGEPKPVGRLSTVPELTLIDALPATPIVPDPYQSLYKSTIDWRTREIIPMNSTESLDPDRILHAVVSMEPLAAVNLETPMKRAPIVSISQASEFPDIEKPIQTACISAISAMASGKPSSAQVTDWVPLTSRDWCAARLEPRKQHALTKWLSKWKDEDTAVRRNKIAPILLVSGPTGCGKTSLVYAAAAELNIQVLEVSPADFSWQANGKRPMSEGVREALQSRQVKNEGVLSQIVLIDDADILVKQDRSVLNAIASMTDDSKRPLVLTCTDESVITNSNHVELNHIFQIDAIDHVASAFLSFAYRVVLTETKDDESRVITRKEADRIADYTGGDLRRIAMAAELARVGDSRPDEIIPSCIYPVSLSPETLWNHHALIRTLECIDDLPIGLRSQNGKDVVSLVRQSMFVDENAPIYRVEELVRDLSTAACNRVSDVDAAYIALKAFSIRFPGNPISTKAVDVVLRQGEQENDSRRLVEAFVSLKSAFHCNRRQRGIMLNYLGRMAQYSKASEFSTRRVRCILDQFVGSVSETTQLRRMFN